MTEEIERARRELDEIFVDYNQGFISSEEFGKRYIHLQSILNPKPVTDHTENYNRAMRGIC